MLATNHTFSDDRVKRKCWKIRSSVVATGGGEDKVQALKMDEHNSARKCEVALMSMNSTIALLNFENSTVYCILKDQKFRAKSDIKKQFKSYTASL